MPKFPTFAIVFAVSGAAASAEAQRPGLIATYRDSAGTQIVRLDPTVALRLAAGESSHPRLAADGGTVRWQGFLNVLRPGEYRFSATLRGKLRVKVGTAEVLTGDVIGEPATKDGPAVQLDAGMTPLDVEFTRLPGMSCLELRWQGPGLYPEPLPFDVCSHDPKAESDDLRRDARRDHGRLLAEELGCANCHTTIEKPLAERKGPDLGQIGKRAYAGWIDRWLADPHAIRPGTAMPRLFAGDENGRAERYAVASYLASLGGPVPPNKPASDAKQRAKSNDNGKAVFTSVGCVLCHPAKMPAAAGDVKSAYPLGAIGSKTSSTALAAYLADPLAVSPHGRMPDMMLRGSEATDLAHYLCEAIDISMPTGLPSEPSGFAALAGKVLGKSVNASPQRWRDVGRELVVIKRCVNCHEFSGRDVKKIREIDFRSLRGCLDDVTGDAAPRYSLTPDERLALREFIKAPRPAVASPAPAFAARLALRHFNCLVCHQRDGEGGLTADQAETLRRFEKAENAEATTPPPLTGIGHKLLTPALRAVLVDKQRVRPWMGLRMPNYGKDNVGSVAVGLTALDAADPTAVPARITFSADKLDAGRRLVGKAGFGCIACHDFAGQPNSGTRGPDLTKGVARLRYDWYRRWLEQPQRMQPGTRMPQVFTDGKSLLTEIVGGHAGAQAEAMWAYCANGANLPPPDGMDPPTKTLAVAVKDRPVLIRTFMPDAGSRAVAIGYPGGVSVAFDTATGRLAYAWSGNFLDAAPVWGGRGGNPAKPLGSRFWTGPAGTPWGLGSLPPDFAARVGDPAYGALPPEGKTFAGRMCYHFDGYEFAGDGSPAFHYSVAADPSAVLHVTERPGPLKHPAALGVARRFTIRAPAGTTAWFLAGESSARPRVFDGSRIQDLARGSQDVLATGRLLFVKQSDGRTVAMTLAVAPSTAHWRVEPHGNGWQVLAKLPPGGDDQPREVAVHVWTVPSDDADFLKTLLTDK